MSSFTDLLCYPAVRLPTFIYANFTITKGEELRGLFNKPVISDNISNGFHGSGGKTPPDELKVKIWARHHNHVSLKIPAE